jgi:bifunctional enzyme CysN/CysC
MGGRGGGATIWITGLSAAGKTTLAEAVAAALGDAYVLDGDAMRQGLCRDLGFSAADRTENVRRLGEVARLMADAGLTVVVAAISPSARDRDAVRARHDDGALPFLEVHVDTPLETCEARDPKGLYARARRGELRDFTGIDAPYERPAAPDVRVDGAGALEDAVTAVQRALAAATMAPTGRSAEGNR